ncbi:LPS export ABC transporter periplasmic protein LptC [Saprospiraceae bacterium]|nr:LPS export ABC transporter periplasmic protein LptC [Saprospiraceae bacterium]
MYRSLLLVIACIVVSCNNDKFDIKKYKTKDHFSVEIAKDVEMLYSDSAQVSVIIKSPTLKRYTDQGETYDEFPDGLLVEFLDDNLNVSSWMRADYAIRKQTEEKIFVQKNVKLFNKVDDELLTDELIWDEGAEEIYTSKLVKINQPSKGDTSIGIGFRADQEFTRFEIKRNYSAIKNIDKLTEDLEKEN